MGGYKKHAPTVYVVTWEHGTIVKVGYSTKQRWRAFALLGGDVRALHTPVDAFAMESAALDWLRDRAPYAFGSSEESAPYLGPDGGGYAECFRATPDLVEELLATCSSICSGNAQASCSGTCSGAVRAMHATNATDATNARVQDSIGKSSVPEHTAEALDNSRRLASDDSVISPSELHMARFLAEASIERKRMPWRYHGLPIPEEEIQRREYDFETERLQRFVRGQRIAQGAAA
jgi:hypothetical protein